MRRGLSVKDLITLLVLLLFFMLYLSFSYIVYSKESIVPRVKLNQSVNAAEYGITTCSELLDSGKAIVERVDHFGRNSVTKYFVTLLNPDGTKSDSCFEIGQKAYESRVRKNQHILPNAPTPAIKPVHSITFNRELLTLSIDDRVYLCTYDNEIDCFNVQIDSPSDSMLKELDRAMEVYKVESVNWLIGYTAGVYVDFNPKEE